MKQILTFQLNDLQRQQSNDNNNYIDFSIRSFDKNGTDKYELNKLKINNSIKSMAQILYEFET